MLTDLYKKITVMGIPVSTRSMKEQTGLFSIHSNLLEFNVLCQIHQAPSSLSILRKLISVLSTKIGFYALEMSKSVNSFDKNICLLVHINTHLENIFYL